MMKFHHETSNIPDICIKKCVSFSTRSISCALICISVIETYIDSTKVFRWYSLEYAFYARFFFAYQRKSCNITIYKSYVMHVFQPTISVCCSTSVNSFSSVRTVCIFNSGTVHNVMCIYLYEHCNALEANFHRRMHVCVIIMTLHYIALGGSGRWTLFNISFDRIKCEKNNWRSCGWKWYVQKSLY